MNWVKFERSDMLRDRADVRSGVAYQPAYSSPAMQLPYPGRSYAQALSVLRSTTFPLEIPLAFCPRGSSRGMPRSLSCTALRTRIIPVVSSLSSCQVRGYWFGRSASLLIPVSCCHFSISIAQWNRSVENIPQRLSFG